MLVSEQAKYHAGKGGERDKKGDGGMILFRPFRATYVHHNGEYGRNPIRSWCSSIQTALLLAANIDMYIQASAFAAILDFE
jgi:hypothetical protein